VRENRTHGSMRRWEASRTSRLSRTALPTPPADPVTSRGSAYSQFKRALERRTLLVAWTMAAELPKVPLADALSLLLLALDQQPGRFERAAPRWHARLCDEARLTLPEAQLALAALQALAGRGAVGGGQALVAICDVHDLDDVVGGLDAWLEEGHD
jgi:hypothetical protein